jgi:hypothetical protein
VADSADHPTMGDRQNHSCFSLEDLQNFSGYPPDLGGSMENFDH